jgi:hypothetical protein
MHTRLRELRMERGVSPRKQIRVQNCGRSVSNSDGQCVRFTRQVWRLRKSIGNLRLQFLPAVCTTSKAKTRFPAFIAYTRWAVIYGRTLNELLSLYGIPL